MRRDMVAVVDRAAVAMVVADPVAVDLAAAGLAMVAVRAAVVPVAVDGMAGAATDTVAAGAVAAADTGAAAGVVPILTPIMVTAIPATATTDMAIPDITGIRMAGMLADGAGAAGKPLIFRGGRRMAVSRYRLLSTIVATACDRGLSAPCHRRQFMP